MTWNIIRLNSEWRGQIVGSPMLLVKSKLRLHSYGERTRGRQRSLNVPSSFPWTHMLWRDRGKQICIHTTLLNTNCLRNAWRIICSSAAKIMIATWTMRNCRRLRASYTAWRHYFLGALNAQLALRDDIQTSSLFIKIRMQTKGEWMSAYCKTGAQANKPHLHEMLMRHTPRGWPFTSHFSEHMGASDGRSCHLLAPGETS